MDAIAVVIAIVGIVFHTAWTFSCIQITCDRIEQYKAKQNKDNWWTKAYHDFFSVLHNAWICTYTPFWWTHTEKCSQTIDVVLEIVNHAAEKYNRIETEKIVDRIYSV